MGYNKFSPPFSHTGGLQKLTKEIGIKSWLNLPTKSLLKNFLTNMFVKVYRMIPQKVEVQLMYVFA